MPETKRFYHNPQGDPCVRCGTSARLHIVGHHPQGDPCVRCGISTVNHPRVRLHASRKVPDHLLTRARRNSGPPAPEVCRACSGPITTPIYPSGRNVQLVRRVPFCSPLCAMAKMYEEIAMRRALVSLDETGVTCLLCNRKLDIVGSHFRKIHGLTAATNRTELQLALGLPQGTRLASTPLITEQIARGKRKGMPPEIWGTSRAVGNPDGQSKVRAPWGVGQLATAARRRKK